MPGNVGRELDHFEGVVLEVDLQEVRDLVLAACRRLQVTRLLDDGVVEKVDARDDVVGLRLCRLLFNRDCLATPKFHDTELRSVLLRHLKCEDGCWGAVGSCLAHGLREALADEDVVTQHESDAVLTDELCGDDERVGDADLLGLLDVLEVHTQRRTVAEVSLEELLLTRLDDDADVRVSGRDRRSDRVVDARLVEHVAQRLGVATGGDRSEPGAVSGCQDEQLLLDALGLGHECSLEDRGKGKVRDYLSVSREKSL